MIQTFHVYDSSFFVLRRLFQFIISVEVLICLLLRQEVCCNWVLEFFRKELCLQISVRDIICMFGWRSSNLTVDLLIKMFDAFSFFLPFYFTIQTNPTTFAFLNFNVSALQMFVSNFVGLKTNFLQEFIKMFLYKCKLICQQIMISVQHRQSIFILHNL